MKKMEFTNSGKVLFDDNEMELNDFFSILDENIENNDYNVYYDEKKKEFTVCYNGVNYKIILSKRARNDLKNGNLNSITKYLLSLSRIQSMIDVSNDNNGIMVPEILDDDSKELYLSILENEKFSFRNFVLHYGTDLCKSKKYIDDKLDDDFKLDGIIEIASTLAGGIAATVLIFTTNNFAHILWMLAGFAYLFTKYTFCFMRVHIKNRIQRFTKYINKNKSMQAKIKCLEKSFESNNILYGENENINNESISKQNIKNIIPTMINKLIELLKSVNPENRGTLTSEIREFLLDYQKMIGDNSKTDRELFLENKSICERIVDLELRINAAKRLNNNRNYETNCLLEKLDMLEDDSHEVESQKVYCKIR